MEGEKVVSPEDQEGEKNLYLYHHSRPFQYVRYGVIQQEITTDEVFGGAFKWLEKQLGFYPVYLAVGKTEDDIHMTGYQDQWRKVLGFKNGLNEYRKKGEIENQVLFSFKDMPTGGVFMDFVNWHIVLNSQDRNCSITDRERSMIFRPSWNTADWIRHGRRNPGFVQLVVPELDLRKADSIWARNNTTRKELEKMGFGGVEVRRLKAPRFF